MIKKEPALDARASVISLPDQGFVTHADPPSFISGNNERYITVLKLAASCNRILIRTESEKQVLQALCKAVVDSGLYQLAWFGFTSTSPKKRTHRFSKLSVEAGYPAAIENSWLTINKVNLARTALRTRKPAVHQDVFAGVATLQGLRQIFPANIAAAISLPLITGKQMLGTLNLCADEENAFAEEEVKILMQLAEDIAYGLQTYRVKATRPQELANSAQPNQDFHPLMQYASDIIAVVDTAGSAVYISPSVNRQLGYKPGEITGKPILDLVHPQDKKSIESLLQLVITTGTTHTAEARFLQAAGSWLYFNCTIHHQLQEPNIGGLVINLQNISSLKEAETKLLHQAQEQQIIFDAVPAMIYFKDTFNKVLRVNKMATDFYGLPKQEIEGKSMYELNPLFAAKYHKEDIEIITSGIAKLGTIEKVILGNGETKWLQTDKIPYYDKKENSTGIIIFAQEITTQRKTADELRSTLEELKKKNYELDNYFYKVSHDIRAPLCSILGLVNLMKTEQDVQANSVYLGLIERSVKKLDHFIQTIVNHSRALNASTQISFINFKAIVEGCLEELPHTPQKDKITAAIQVHAGGNFYSDPARIAIIFEHLISNSIKFINPYAAQHQLHIDVTVTNTKAYILVEDNGIGIEKKYLNKVFNMFFKATDKSTGAGLGLYVVKQTVDKLGGTITIKSEIGKGTSFKITLPNFRGHKE